MTNKYSCFIYIYDHMRLERLGQSISFVSAGEKCIYLHGETRRGDGLYLNAGEMQVQNAGHVKTQTQHQQQQHQHPPEEKTPNVLSS